MQDVAEQKSALRAEIRERRAQQTDADRFESAGLFTHYLRRLVDETEARSLCCFVPMSTEPDTRKFISWAHGEGIRVLLPISREDGLLDWVESSAEAELTLSHVGVPEPAGERLGPDAAADVDLMLIPAAAVDVHGNRLGWGRGYFDRALSGLSKRPDTYAVVFEGEVLPEVPTEDHDHPITGWVTPNGIGRA